jgi:hypothetical protein
VTEAFEDAWNNEAIQFIRRELMNGRMPTGYCDCLNKLGRIPPQDPDPVRSFVTSEFRQRNLVQLTVSPSLQLATAKLRNLDRRDEFIQTVVNGKTFADVGGLWGVVNEKLSVAHKAGANDVTLVDMCPADNPDWKLFAERMIDFGIAPSIIKSNFTSVADRYNVVHSSGVVYHCPDFEGSIKALLKLATDYLILSSCVCRPLILTSHGRLLSPDKGFYIPTLSNAVKKHLKEHWKNLSGDNEAIGITVPSDFRRDDYAPFWHLPSIKYFRETVLNFGGKIIEESSFWDGNAYTLLIDSTKCIK